MITVKINRTLLKSGENIKEIWTVNPANKILIDESREIYHIINYVMLIKSIHKDYDLIESTQYDFRKINIYKYDGTKPMPENLCIDFFIPYQPSGGFKTCTKCSYFKKLADQNFCMHRKKFIHGDYWKNCEYWFENYCWWKTGDLNGELHQQKRSRENRRASEGILADGRSSKNQRNSFYRRSKKVRKKEEFDF